MGKKNGYINVGIGDSPGAKSSGQNNVFIGRLAGYGQGSGFYGSTGNNQVFIGHRAGYSVQSGDGNVGIGTANVTIDGNSAETIDGLTTIILYNQYASITIVSDNSNWIIV